VQATVTVAVVSRNGGGMKRTHLSSSKNSTFRISSDAVDKIDFELRHADHQRTVKR
jgi:hypothetical protein